MDDVIDKLVVVRKVIGFANIGVLPAPRFVDMANSYLGDEGIDIAAGEEVLSQSGRAVASLQRGLLPSQDICQSAMTEIDRVLNPLRHARREANLTVVAPAQRPTTH